MSQRQSIADIRAQLAAAEPAQLAALLRRHGEDERAGVQSACASASRRLEATRAEHARMVGLYEMERALRGSGCVAVAGVDEVGRGAVAGPVTAGAVILPAEPLVLGLDDSKRLSPRRRTELAVEIRAQALAVSVAHVPAADIDTLGISAALRRAMREALAGLPIVPDHVVVDGLPMGIWHAESAVVKGDSRVAAIAAASIVAKVERDALMVSLDDAHPGYGLGDHKGYGTLEHLEAVRSKGPSEVHRRSFLSSVCDATLF